MSRRNKIAAASRRGWRRMVLAAVGAAVLAGAGWGVRTLLQGAPAQPAPPAPAAAPPVIPEAPPSNSDYTHRIVAYVYDNQPVTRAELGEYLIARHGPEKLSVLVNRGVIEQACRARGIEVTAGEIEAALAESAQGLNMDRAAFQKNVLSRYRMNITEWKEEILRPRLLLTKLCRDQVSVTAEELQHAFEAHYGEKIECRIILYPKSKEGYQQALAEYGTIRGNPEAFEKKAKSQYRSDLAGCAGRIKPFGRYEMEDDELDKIAFRLQPGEISQVVESRQGPVVLWCLSRRPPDSSVHLSDVREQLIKDLIDNKVNVKMQEIVRKMKDDAHPQLLLTRPSQGSAPAMPAGSAEPQPNQVVAVYNGNIPITREELGEYLITCFGEDSVEFLVNRLIIDKECAALGIQVSEQEIDAALKADLVQLGKQVGVEHLTEAMFVKEFLGQHRKTLYEYREDAIRARLLLAKMCQGKVRITEQEVRQAFEAHYGEQLECRMILWPEDQIKFALADYPRLRDSEEAFAQKAKQQPSATLAAKEGRLPRFGHWMLGDEQLEQAAFRLQPGEVSSLIGTRQGQVILKCDRRIPPQTGVSLEKVRPQLEQEVHDRKVQMELGVVFGELKKKANPQIMLRGAERPTDIREETSRILADMPAGERARIGLPPLPPRAPAH
jgi:parvulin-like peptidyl-prolyl isomerase